jgi:hypothetical protein
LIEAELPSGVVEAYITTEMPREPRREPGLTAPPALNESCGRVDAKVLPPERGIVLS